MNRLSRSNVSIIIPAHSESRTLFRIIREAKQVQPGSEIIVVCEAAKDHTARIAKKAGASKVVRSNTLLRLNEGRSLGAKHASGDILLFMDADVMIPSELLRQYVRKAEEGWDLVLNPYSGISPKHPANIAKHLLNHMLGRPDLSGSSLITVPHALSRHALKVIGRIHLSVPPLAQAVAVANRLPVTTSGFFRPVKMNKRKPVSAENVKEIILGDHAEAVSYLVSQRGLRAGMTDFGRCREAITLPVQLL
ncbi:glycosyltransferase [Cohnella pontilimi]|uniref:Glycosyltransferase n=1 Tax=Cohnella pontilimi TaxID=2564100 RepID=A0A4V5LSH3_9BACL|nr:glycosyltransferase [Cohnella pontilimi]TJY43099.1 glycosyltransferase [Cohnella pontilimi]